jgi:hypothetical protein
MRRLAAQGETGSTVRLDRAPGFTLSVVSRRFVMGRALLAGLFVLLMGAHAIRSAIVATEAEDKPALAARVWPSHPNVLRSKAMLGVGEAAAQGRPVPSAVLEQVRQLSKQAPLAEEPFLIRGAIAVQEGEYSRAERHLLQARRRSPRSRAGRFLLADLYLRQQKVLPALQEMVVLTRISPQFISSLAPMLADYARTPGAVPRLRRVLADNPSLETALLSQLAADPANAELIFSLVTQLRQARTELLPWQERLLSSMVEAGQYKRAFSLWQRLSGGEAREAVEGDAPFRRSDAKSPFVWAFTESAEGAAEPENGELRVLFFGRSDVTLASRVLVLPPGRYQLSMRVSGDVAAAEGVRWVAICLREKTNLFDLPLSGASSGTLVARFQVPPECDAQQLQLKGFAQTYPAASEVRTRDFTLRRVPQ